MAVFGVPIVHDDDAERATRAAIACRGRIAELNARGRLTIDVRIGVNTGEAVAGTGQTDHFLVTGTPVNVAARLQQAAAPGEILIGALTRRLTQGSVLSGASRSVDAKGVGTIEAWPVTEMTSAVPEAHRGLEGLHAPLIGRDHEVRLLHDALARVADERAPSLVTIYGPAGAGKSRLVAEFAAQVARVRVSVGRALPYGEGITFYPIQQILRGELGIEHGDPHAAAVEKLRAGVNAADDAEREGIVARLSVVLGLASAHEALPGVESEDVAEELRLGVRRFLELRAVPDPLVLVFEDLHWAEVALLDLVEHIAEWTRAPLLVVALARPEFREARPAWGAHAANAASLSLAPLDGDETRRLIGALLTVETLPETLRSEITTKAQGNPLYVEEFLRMLIDAGRIREHDGRWIATSDLSDLEIPPTLQALITARVDSVGPDVKRLLQRASLVGRLFSTAALEAIGGEAPRADLIRDVVRRGLLVEADERAPGEGRAYRFKHVLIRDVTYGTIPKAERSRMHDNYGRWLERTFGDRHDEVADIVAYHAEQAFLLTSELGGADAPQLGARSLALLADAARRAGLRDDPAALGLYERAANVSDRFAADPSVRANVHAGRAMFRYWGRQDTESLEPALALCEACPGAGNHVYLLNLIANRAFKHEEYDRARRLWERGVEVGASLPSAQAVAASRLFRAIGSYHLGEVDRFGELLADALACAREADEPSTLARALWWGRMAAMWRGELSLAARLLDEGDAAYAALRSRRMELSSMHEHAQLQLACGDYTECVRIEEAVVSGGRDLGYRRFLAQVLWFLGEARSELRDWHAARAALEEAATIFASFGERGQMPEASARAARACIALGDLRAAAAHIATAESALLRTDSDSRYITFVAKAELAAAERSDADADGHFRAALAAAARGRHDLLAQGRVAYALFLMRAGRAPEAREQLLAARAFYADPLASRRLDKIDALLKRCEVGV